MCPPSETFSTFERTSSKSSGRLKSPKPRACTCAKFRTGRTPFAFFTSVRISSRLPTTSVRPLASIPRREGVLPLFFPAPAGPRCFALPIPASLPADLDDQLRRDLPRRAADVVLARIPFVQVHADQLDLHRRQAEIVDVLDSVPQGPPLAGQWDARRPKTNHALTERRMATARLLFCKA